jgi:hypothetical protein
MKLLPFLLSVVGCGKAERHEVESAVLSSIYEDPAFFETVCDFPIESSPQPRVQVLEAEGEAQPWFGVFGGKPVPGTARIRLTNVVKKGESGERTCDARIGFLWSETKKAVVEHRGKYMRPASNFHAEAFKKLGP